MTASWNTQWNTPPDGDFVRYIEQLTAQSAALARAHRARPSQHSFDEADSDYVEAHDARAAAARRQEDQPPAQQPPMLDELLSRGARTALDALRGKLAQGIPNPRKTR